jgi:hypothetical protein
VYPFSLALTTGAVLAWSAPAAGAITFRLSLGADAGVNGVPRWAAIGFGPLPAFAGMDALLVEPSAPAGLPIRAVTVDAAVPGDMTNLTLAPWTAAESPLATESTALLVALDGGYSTTFTRALAAGSAAGVTLPAGSDTVVILAFALGRPGSSVALDYATLATSVSPAEVEAGAAGFFWVNLATGAAVVAEPVTPDDGTGGGGGGGGGGGAPPTPPPSLVVPRAAGLSDAALLARLVHIVTSCVAFTVLLPAAIFASIRAAKAHRSVAALALAVAEGKPPPIADGGAASRFGRAAFCMELCAAAAAAAGAAFGVITQGETNAAGRGASFHSLGGFVASAVVVAALPLLRGMAVFGGCCCCLSSAGVARTHAALTVLNVATAGTGIALAFSGLVAADMGIAAIAGYAGGTGLVVVVLALAIARCCAAASSPLAPDPVDTSTIAAVSGDRGGDAGAGDRGVVAAMAGSNDIVEMDRSAARARQHHVSATAGGKNVPAPRLAIV